MAGETTITITGHLTRDPELRTPGNGHPVCNLTIASSTRQYNRDSNQWEDGDTLFLNCTAWDSTHAALASNIAASLSKGASSTRQYNRDSNQWEDGDTLFLNCTAWDSTHAALASNIAASLSKGMSVIAHALGPCK